MNGFFGKLPSRQEMEIEADFERAFSLLLQTPKVSSIDIGVSSMPESITLWRLEELCEHYGLELELQTSGYLKVRRAAKTANEKVTAPFSIPGFAVKHWLSREGSTLRRRLSTWNFIRRPVAR